jgi:N-acyl-L-homoserine lactone synthetase
MSGGCAEADALALMDELAPRVLAWVAPLRFGLAETASVHDAVFHLRCRAVVDRGWAKPAAFPDGRERDAFDERAVFVVGFDGAELVATNRLVFPASGLPLPTEANFALAVDPAGRVVDWSRQVVAPGRWGMHRALAGLLGRSWQETRKRGYSQVCGNVSAAMVRLYRRLGISVTILAPAAPYAGEERLPIRFDLLASAPALAAWFACSVGEDVCGTS